MTSPPRDFARHLQSHERSSEKATDGMREPAPNIPPIPRRAQKVKRGYMKPIKASNPPPPPSSLLSHNIAKQRATAHVLRRL